jgi:pimeloyl-ACP methyl ester carboxylesterase
MHPSQFQVQGIDVFVDGDGPQTLVMLHGWPDTQRLWDGTVAALAPQYRCVRFTLPGFDAAHRGTARTLAEITALLLAIVDAVSPQQAVTLVLHDWGCIFGYELAARHPERVARIVAIDIGDYNSGAYLKALRGREKLHILGYQLWLALAWGVGRVGAAGLANRMTRWMARAMRCPAPQVDVAWPMNYPYAMTWLGLAGGLRGTAQVRPHCPMFYAYGTRKPFMFHSPEWLHTLNTTPGSAVQEYACGHWVMVDRAAALQAQVLAWLVSTPSSPKS